MKSNMPSGERDARSLMFLLCGAVRGPGEKGALAFARVLSVMTDEVLYGFPRIDAVLGVGYIIG